MPKSIDWACGVPGLFISQGNEAALLNELAVPTMPPAKAVPALATLAPIELA